MKNIHTKLHVRLLQLSNQTAGETCQQAVVHPLQIYWRAVTCEDNTLSVAEKVVEDVEEGVLRLRCSSPFLYIIYYQHINRLIEVNEVIGSILAYRIGVLYLEQSCRDIQHTLLRIKLLCSQSDSIHKVSLSTAGRTIDKHRIELCCIGVFSNRKTDGTGQLVTVTLHIVAE